jgi:hypothetical protein
VPLQRGLNGMLPSNLNFLKLKSLLFDVMAIADQVDGQLTQSMVDYTELGEV